MKTIFCPNCLADNEVTYVQKPETFVVRDERVQIMSKVAKCATCGNDVFDMDADEKNLRTTYDEYRIRHGLLTSHQVKAIRAKYGLSQRALSRLLGWGLVTIQRYEQGSLQNTSHDLILRRCAEDPMFLLEQLEDNRDQFSAKEWKRIHSGIRNEAERQSCQPMIDWFEKIEKMTFQQDPESRGLKSFQFEKVAQVVLWLAENIRNLFKTKLAKLLWVSDFAHYHRYGTSITGLAYSRLPYGPVPDRYQTLLGLLEDKQVIDLVPVEYSDRSGEIIVPHGDSETVADCGQSFLSSSGGIEVSEGKRGRVVGTRATAFGGLDSTEIEVLKRVVRLYGHLASEELTRVSHVEPLWQSRANGRLLPYGEASSVNMVKRLWEE